MDQIYINQSIDDNNDGFINDNEHNYYDKLIEYNMNLININPINNFDKIKYENDILSYIVYIMFNAVIYKLIVGEKKMYELYGPKTLKKEITLYNDINSID